MRSKILGLTIGVIILICLAIAGGLSCLNLHEQTQEETQKEELKLSDFPDVFKNDTLIVIGENGSQIEKESAEAIVAKLENLTGNTTIIINDTAFMEDNKTKYNLILVGTPESNSLLHEVYNLTNATKVTEEYPGKNKGILEILRSPWNEDKAMLLVEGSDEWGVKAGSEILGQAEENKSGVIVKWEDFEAKTIKFDSLPNPYNLSNHTETAKLSLNKKYGENWYKKYQVGWHYKHPSISFDYWFVRINSDFCILVTSEEAYFLSPEDFNEFLELYGKNVSLEKDRDVIHLFEIYLKLYGLSSSVQDEEMFTERHLELWTDETKERYNIDPKKFTLLGIKREDCYYLLDCYTITRVPSSPRVPSPQDVIISHYSVKIGNKGEISLNLINRTKYEQVIPSGPR